MNGAYLLEPFVAWSRASGHGETTIYHRVDTIRRCATHHDTDPEDLTRDQILSWLANRDWLPNTRVTYWRAMRAWCHYLTDLGRPDPMTGLKAPRSPIGVPRPVTTPQLTACVHAATGDLRTWLLLGSYEGLRVHEIAKIRGEELRGAHLDVTGKGGARWTVPLHPAVAELAHHYPPVGYWFPPASSRSNRPHISPGTISRRVSQHFREHGIPTGSAHRLRHWLGTETLRVGGNLLVTSQMLRHSSTAITSVYALVLDDDRQATMAALPIVT